MNISSSSNGKGAHRRYPSLYEKAVPIALGVIAVIIVILAVISVAVALGWFPGAY